MTTVNISVQLSLTPVGNVVLGPDGRPLFPRLPAAPAVYQLEFASPAGNDKRVYIGETANVRRRSQNYRTPGPSQRTSWRINALLCGHLVGGGRVILFTASSADVVSDGVGSTLDLTTKAGRVLAEHGALVATALTGTCELLNL